MSDRDSLAAMLARLSYRHGTFRLASGKTSDFYVDVKQTVMSAEGAGLIGKLLYERLRVHGVSCVGGMAVGAVPLVTAALAAAGTANAALDGFFVRKEAKEHGTARKIDGRFAADARIALVEDVVTTGESTLQAIDAIEAAGGRVELVVTVVDRQEDDGSRGSHAAPGTWKRWSLAPTSCAPPLASLATNQKGRRREAGGPSTRTKAHAAGVQKRQIAVRP
jgi:orotate phosphoribosyltransferase